MKINEIYKKYGITPNLQEHMLRVCAVVEFVQKYWQGKEVIDWDLARKIALLHDLGNIVKFDFDKYQIFLGDEQKNIDYWKSIRAIVIQKYGNDDHEVTKVMLSESGFDDGSIELILNKSFGNSVEVEKSNNWVLKILYYADLRTLPFGIGSLEDRISDIKERMPKYTNRPDFENLVVSCRKIEKQIQENLSVTIGEINNYNIKVSRSFLELSVN